MHECIINQIIYISRICFKRKKLAFVSSKKKKKKKKSWLSSFYPVYENTFEHDFILIAGVGCILTKWILAVLVDDYIK